MAEIFIYWENPEGRKILGYVSFEPEAFPSEPIPFTTRGEDQKQGFLDLSGVRRGLRGPKLVGVEIEKLKKEIAVSRRTGRGYQTISTTDRLSIQVLPIAGLSR